MTWLYRFIKTKKCIALLLALFATASVKLFAQTGLHDTLTTYAIVYEGDTIEAKTLANFEMYAKYGKGNMSKHAQMTRLRNAIYVTFPYASRSGLILNDMNAHLAGISNKSERKAYIRSREKDLKKDFTEPLTNLSVYQGKVLMKLINRQTGNNCYEIIKEYKGGFTARFYQTVAFFFGNNLKQSYDAAGEDREMEMIVKEFCQSYGYSYSVYKPM